MLWKAKVLVIAFGFTSNLKNKRKPLQDKMHCQTDLISFQMYNKHENIDLSPVTNNKAT